MYRGVKADISTVHVINRILCKSGLWKKNNLWLHTGHVELP